MGGNEDNNWSKNRLVVANHNFVHENYSMINACFVYATFKKRNSEQTQSKNDRLVIANRSYT